MVQILDKYGNTSTDDGTLIVIDKDGNIKKLGGGPSTIPTLQQVLDYNHNLVNGINLQGTNAGAGNTGISVNLLGGYAGGSNSGTNSNFLGNFAGYQNSGSSTNGLGYQALRANSANNVNGLGDNAGYSNSGVNVNVLGYLAGSFNTGGNINALGYYAARLNTGVNVNAFGYQSALSNTGSYVNALGANSASGNSGQYVNAFGINAGVNNIYNSVNLFGVEATADADNQAVFTKELPSPSYAHINARLSYTNITTDRKYTLPDTSGTIPLTVNGYTADSLGAITIPVGTGTLTAVTASTPLASSGGTTPNITIQQASGSQAGYLSSTDWTTFNTKEPAITAGTTSQYWRGDKTWQTFPTIPTVTPSALTKTDDTNVTLTLGGSPSTALLQATSLTLGWTGTLADSRIASASTWNGKQNALSGTGIVKSTAGTISYLTDNTANWDTAYTNRITSLTTTGSSGSATLSSNTLNIPTYTLAGLGGITLTSLSSTATGLTYTNTTGVFSLTSGYLIPTTASYNNTNWDTAYTDRNKWDGGATGLVASTGRTSLGATTVGDNLFTLTNPSAITFLRINADNTVSTLDASTFRTAIGAGTSSTTGTVTSVSALTLGTSGTDLTSTVANGTTTPVITLNVPDASATARGVITTAAQTIAGAKTFSTAPILSSLTASQILALDGSGNIQSLAVATYPSLTELSYVKGVTSAIQTQLSGKQATLTNPVTGTGTNNEIAYFNTTGSTIGSLTTATYPSLTELSYVKGVTSAIQTQIGTKQDISLSAYTFRANNTAGTANATDNTFKSIAQQTYSGTIAWTGTTAPSGTANHSYRWSQVGKLVTLRITLIYSVAGVALTAVNCTLPTDCPTPEIPTGSTANGSYLYEGSGTLATAIINGGASGTVNGGISELKINSSGTGYEIQIYRFSNSYITARATIQYYAQ